MKLTTMTQITLDGVSQGNGEATDEERKEGFDRGGWARGAGDDETRAFIAQTYLRADAFLFGRRTYELFARSWGTVPVVLGQGRRLFPDSGPDIALELIDARVDSKGVAIHAYRPNGRPQYRPTTY